MMEIPAAMLKKKTSHMIVNSRERRYAETESGSSGSAEPFAATAEAAPSGAGGLLNARLDGIRMQANTTPSQAKTSGSSPAVARSSTGASTLLSSSATTPNPMTTIPVASPLRSGNHLTAVATGVTYPSPIPAPPMTP